MAANVDADEAEAMDPTRAAEEAVVVVVTQENMVARTLAMTVMVGAAMLHEMNAAIVVRMATGPENSERRSAMRRFTLLRWTTRRRPHSLQMPLSLNWWPHQSERQFTSMN
jgi:hypothetical protein